MFMIGHPEDPSTPAVEARKSEHDRPQKEGRQHKSSYTHVPTCWSLLQKPDELPKYSRSPLSRHRLPNFKPTSGRCCRRLVWKPDASIPQPGKSLVALSINSLSRPRSLSLRDRVARLGNALSDIDKHSGALSHCRVVRCCMASHKLFAFAEPSVTWHHAPFS